MKPKTKSDRKLKEINDTFNIIWWIGCSIITISVITFTAVKCTTTPHPLYNGPAEAYESCINEGTANSFLLNISDIRVDEYGKEYDSCIDRDQKVLGNAGCPLFTQTSKEFERIENYCRELYLDIKQ